MPLMPASLHRILPAAAIVVTTFALPAPAYAQFATPEAVVHALYGYYGLGRNDSNDFPQDDKTLHMLFVPALFDLWKAAEIDADFFVQGQDFALSDMKISPAGEAGDTATVAVAFKNMGEPVRLTFELASAKDGWRISDVRAADGSTFRQFLESSR